LLLLKREKHASYIIFPDRVGASELLFGYFLHPTTS
jgi:hypothetical protein